MPENIYETLKNRGYIAQVTHEEDVQQLLASPGATFYIGFDPTADSLHVGHFVQMMVMAHLQKAGHRPIVLLGGGTGMIGDPSGRSDLRQVLDENTIQSNVNRFREQMKILIDFTDDRAIMVDNAEWLRSLNYIAFLREIGSQFSVNRMLSAECFKQRLEKGLSFLEFNYMLMQAYDFLVLYRRYGCQIQLGGDDQWSNILAGVDLVRRKEQGAAFGMTFKLLTTKAGTKMGKTANGAVWLDAEKTTPFAFYQYWRNIDDADVVNCLKLLTFIDLSEIEAYARLSGEEVNEAKKRLAWEVTGIVHGKAAADQAAAQAVELFAGSGRSEQMPTSVLSEQEYEHGVNLLDLLLRVGMIPSKGEGRRLMQQRGLTLNSDVILDVNRIMTADDFSDGEAIVRKGKKAFHRFVPPAI
ncbi:MAG: tyrosine--tRNA ligase [Ruminococcaceae bacterium]|nr:tyrosine--tRNA ligase [Oscillospiraceae bacterium]